MFCPICGAELKLEFTTNKRTQRCGVMLVCPEDGRHFRGFINDPKSVRRAVDAGDPKVLLVKGDPPK